MKTYMAKAGEPVVEDKKWYIVDLAATSLSLGRVAAKVAPILMGKHRPEYTPHVDTGDYVIILNADQVRVTGAAKPTQKTYDRYSGYPGGRKVQTYAEMAAEKPCDIVALAIRRMLPKTRLGRKMFKKLKVYAGAKHDHQAQQPEALEL